MCCRPNDNLKCNSHNIGAKIKRSSCFVVHRRVESFFFCDRVSSNSQGLVQSSYLLVIQHNVRLPYLRRIKGDMFHSAVVFRIPLDDLTCPLLRRETILFEFMSYHINVNDFLMHSTFVLEDRFILGSGIL